MIEITTRQQQVLDFLRAFSETDGRMPTGPEIAAHFGFKDPSPAYQHLDALEAKGFIKIRRYGYGRPFAIRIIDRSPRPTLRDACRLALTCANIDSSVRKVIEEAIANADRTYIALRR